MIQVPRSAALDGPFQGIIAAANAHSAARFKPSAAATLNPNDPQPRALGMRGSTALDGLDMVACEVE